MGIRSALMLRLRPCLQASQCGFKPVLCHFLLCEHRQLWVLAISS